MPDRDEEMTWWIRGYLLFASVQGLGIGVTGLVAPTEMQIPLRLTPLNARFAAALYVAGGVGVLLAAFARRRSEARSFVLAFGFATLLILVLTALHWADFMAESLPHRPVWIFDYLVDPILAAVVVPLGGLWPPRHAAGDRLTPLLRIQAVAFGALAVLLLVAPDLAAAYWPWVLPPIAGQLYACFLLTFAVGGVLASRESQPAAVRTFVASSLALALLVLLVSVLHVDRFKPDFVTVLWFGAFGVCAIAFGVALTRPWLWRGSI